MAEFKNIKFKEEKGKQNIFIQSKKKPESWVLILI